MAYLKSGRKPSTCMKESAKYQRARSKQYKEVERYYKTVEIRLLEDRPTTLEEFEEAYKQAKRVRGNAVSYYSLVRHSYTNYDEICAYVANRWAILNKDLIRDILHPRLEKLICSYLRELREIAGVIDYRYPSSRDTCFQDVLPSTNRAS